MFDLSQIETKEETYPTSKFPDAKQRRDRRARELRKEGWTVITKKYDFSSLATSEGESTGVTYALEAYRPRQVVTKMTYTYRDAANYKKRGCVIVRGRLTFANLAPYLDADLYFIPEDVGLEPAREGWDEQLDHCWHELTEDDFEEVGPDRTSPRRTAAELIGAFRQAAEAGWPGQAVEPV